MADQTDRAAPAFVAGATGYTGRGVVRALRERGLAVVAHIRPDSPALDTLGPRFESLGATVDTTPWREQPLGLTLERVQPGTVFALLGTTRARGRAAARAGRPPETYQTVDLGLTLMLLQAAGQAAPGARLLYLSAMGADKSRNSYYNARYQAEQAIRHGPLPWTIARPSFISGPDREERRVGERVGARLADGALNLASRLGGRGLRERYASMTGDALGRALVSLALDPRAANRVFEAPALRERAGRWGQGSAGAR